MSSAAITSSGSDESELEGVDLRGDSVLLFRVARSPRVEELEEVEEVVGRDWLERAARELLLAVSIAGKERRFWLRFDANVTEARRLRGGRNGE